jgi:Ankyrin repeats (many copies)
MFRLKQLNEILNNPKWVCEVDSEPVDTGRQYSTHQQDTLDRKVIQGDTALHVAIKFGRWTEIQRLIKEGADVNAQNIDGQTPLLLLMEEQYEDAYYSEVDHYTRELIQNPDIDFTLADHKGNTPLILLCKMMWSNEHRINKLPRYFVEILNHRSSALTEKILNAKDNDGNTVFHHLAAGQCNVDVRQQFAADLILLAKRNNANINLSTKNNKNKTAVELSTCTKGVYALLDYYTKRMNDKREYYITFNIFCYELHPGYSRTKKLEAVEALLNFYKVDPFRPRTLVDCNELKRHMDCLSSGELGKVYSKYFEEDVNKIITDLERSEMLKSKMERAKEEYETFSTGYHRYG